MATLVEDVTRDKVKGLLLQRQPEILESDVPDQLVLFLERVGGAATSVVLLTGSDPFPGPIRNLAAEAIAYETASVIEYADYPEQQGPGLDGRGYYLHQQYLEKLAELRAVIAALGGTIPPDGGEGGVSLSPSPVGCFPQALPYPDPVEVPRGTWYRTW